MHIHCAAYNFACKNLVLHNRENPSILKIGVQTNEHKWSEASRLCKLAWENGGFFGHNASFEDETKMSCNKAPEIGDVESRNIENYFREAA
jgi:hypothetical protein